MVCLDSAASYITDACVCQEYSGRVSKGGENSLGWSTWKCLHWGQVRNEQDDEIINGPPNKVQVLWRESDGQEGQVTFWDPQKMIQKESYYSL